MNQSNLYKIIIANEFRNVISYNESFYLGGLQRISAKKKPALIQMKTIIMVLLFSLLSNILFAQNVNIPDVNFKNALLNNIAVNLNSDAEIQESEAIAFNGDLIISNLDIADLTGIEAFVNVNYIDCNYNKIVNLDVSNNQNLTSLACIYNQLETLIVGNNPNIIWIICYGSKLTSLDVSGLSSIVEVRCGNSSIKMMDLTQNPLLNSFDCRNSTLRKLDMRNGNNSAISFFYIPNNPDLKCVNVDDVDFATTNWTDIDPWLEFSMECFPYFINFSVTDGISPINGAIITLRSIVELSELTNASGTVTFSEIGKGDFSYKVEAPGYKGVAGKVTITDSDKAVDVVLNLGETDVLTTITDTIFKNYLLDDLSINTNGDQEIQITEAQYFNGGFDLNNLGIKNLSGIESFNHIVYLNCSGNVISLLDLSNNLELKSLSSINGYLDFLILGNNSNLTSVLCYGNNIASLDVSKLSSISTLRCGNNQLTNMDLSQNPLLTTFDCRASKLTSLDLRNGNNSAITTIYLMDNPDLGCVSVDDVSFANGNWTNIDAGVVFSTDCAASYQVSFNVSDGTNPIENAHLKFNGVYYHSNSLGEVSIPGVGTGDYIFSIIAAGFESIISSIIVTENTSENIVLNTGVAEIVYIPDYNFRTYLLGINTLNTNDDTDIQVSEAIAFNTSLDASNMGITDMTGLEAFVNITSLKCNSNTIVSLDVSHNNLLTSLSCLNNGTIESLTLGDQPNLSLLFCYGNKLTSLNVGDLLALEQLNCGSNPFTQMDLSKNLNLTYFDCRSSQLSQLDVRNGNNTAITFFYIPDNPLLTCVSVDDVNFSSSNWTDIDVGLIFSLSCNGSNDASLSGIQVDGNDLPEFQSGIYSYQLILSDDTAPLPVVAAFTNDANATLDITQAGSLNGTANIEVTAEDGLAKQSYQIEFSLQTSIDKNSIASIRTYPNPVENFLTIDMDKIPEEITIYNVYAEIVKELKPNSRTVNVSSLNPGIYFLSIKEIDRTVFVKFIKN